MSYCSDAVLDKKDLREKTQVTGSPYKEGIAVLTASMWGGSGGGNLDQHQRSLQGPPQ